MIPLIVGQSKNSQPSFKIQMSDTKYSAVLDSSDESTIVVPAGANQVLIVGDGPVYWSLSSFTKPSTSTFSSTEAEFMPALRAVTPGQTLYIQVKNNQTDVQLSFFSGGA